MFKPAILLLAFVCLAPVLFAQNHKNICQLTVQKAEPVVMNNKLRWYKIVIHNGSAKTVDAVEWNAVFYDKFGKSVGTAKGTYSSGGLVSKPIKPGENLTDRETPEGIGDADRIVISIKKVHFLESGNCH